MENDEHIGLPDLVTDDEDQESINGKPIFEVQDDGIIVYMHNIIIMTFPNEAIRVNKQTGQIVPLRNIVCGPIKPTVSQLESWAVSDNGASEAFNMYMCMYEASDVWMQHGLHQTVNTCQQMIWLRRVGMFFDYKFAYSKDSECTERHDCFFFACRCYAHQIAC
jgi:hypothetical protein